MVEENIRPRDLRFFQRALRTTAQLVDFVDASSKFYPELRRWYERDDHECADSRRVRRLVEVAFYGVVAVAAGFSLARADSFSLGPLDGLIFAYFGLAVLSLSWATDRKRCLLQLGRWLAIGMSAFIVAKGFSLPHSAALIAGGAFLYLLAGLGLDLKTEAYRPPTRYRFSGIGHPNWQAETCLLLLFSTTYLYDIGALPAAAWIPLLTFTVVLLVLTRSRTSFWAAVATATVWTVLQLAFSIDPTGLVVSLALAVIAGTLVRRVSAPEPVPVKQPGHSRNNGAPSQRRQSWERRLSAIVHLGRDSDVRRRFGGRTGLWAFAWKAIRERPYLGYGYGVFWTPRRVEDTLRTLGWSAGSSHSIYLDNLLNTGPAGLLVFLAVLAAAALQALSAPPPDAVFLGSLILLVSIEGLFESHFLTPSFRSFSFFVVLFSIS